ncbi:hypothetical protein KSP40_PGU006414 [Platanthera guangdongensis]|uniref:Uncharacterized protein n=1 Tax=Platanthera guangdongensis TaxID=2320717 RepID=A0ABR2LL18_9ASPA
MPCGNLGYETKLKELKVKEKQLLRNVRSEMEKVRKEEKYESLLRGKMKLFNLMGATKMKRSSPWADATMISLDDSSDSEEDNHCREKRSRSNGSFESFKDIMSEGGPSYTCDMSNMDEIADETKYGANT